MAKMDTKEVFDLYFKDIPFDTARKCRPQVDRPEVYSYELEVGKQIFDMDVDELFGLLLSFNKSREFGDSNFSISYNSYDQIASKYRSIWNFYIDNIEIIRNPWNDKRMRGAAATKRLVESKTAFTYDIIEQVIGKINKDYKDTDYEYGKYLECLILLFYNGFAEAQEIVLLKEDDINFNTREVKLPGRTICLSDRCFELLKFVHSLNEIHTLRLSFDAVPYQDGYFKIAIKRKADDADPFCGKSLVDVGAILTRKISMNIRKKYNIDINYRIIYLLGFYDYIVGRAGEERTKELIMSIRNSEDAIELIGYAKEYGVVAENVSYIKKLLRPFI